MVDRVKLTGTTSSDVINASVLTTPHEIYGRAGNDTITGTAFDDIIVGEEGHDDLFGGAGNDLFLVVGGSAGEDLIDGGGGHDIVLGDAGNTTIRLRKLTVSQSVEEIDGGGGTNTLAGTSAKNTLDFSATLLVNIDLIDGDKGHDTIIGSNAGDVISGGEGNDDLFGGNGNDVFRVSGSTSGEDQIDGGAGYDVIRGDDGNTTIRLRKLIVSQSIEEINGGGGSNTVAGTAAGNVLDFSGTSLVNIDLIDGGKGNDTITGTGANDVIVGGEGNDDLFGGNGNDVFRVSGSTSGEDQFDGGAGYDVIRGDDGSTTIRLRKLVVGQSVEEIDGGGGSNTVAGTAAGNILDFSATSLVNIGLIDGGKGNDTITGTGVNDVIVGGEGNDDLFGGNGNDLFRVSGATSGEDQIDGGAGDDVIRGDDGDTIIRLRKLIASQSVEEIDGGGGHNTITGTSAGNTLDFGGTSLVNIDLIDGGNGNDVITGTAGDDRIMGGRGNDVLTGRGGLDTAVFSGAMSNYQITINGGLVTVKDLVGTDGIDKLTNFSFLHFSDQVHDVTGGIRPPNAVADTASTNEDTAITVNVLANDNSPAGTALTLTAVTQGANGTVGINPDNTVTYAPKADFFGTDTFTYTVNSGPTSTATASVTLTILPAADAPIAQNDQATTTPGTPVRIDVLGNDTDPDGDALAIESFSQAAHGAVSRNGDGTLTYTPNSGYIGADTFSYVVTDQGLSRSATVSLQVAPSLEGLNFRQILTAVPENDWVRVNLNHFQDVWTPVPQLANGGTKSPKAVIGAWSSMAWDSERGDLIFWGGGHANYPGNEVYRWHSSTLQWERASLPSQVVEVANNRFEAVDGYLNAPTSSHTYDNSEYLPIVDRFLVFGGAAYDTGGPLVRSDGVTLTGPYFWDPSKGDANAVGGTAGSQVNPLRFPNVVGGEMWENRDNLGLSGFRGSLVNGTTAYVEENGKDVVYFGQKDLWKYTINDINDPSKDTYEKVGRYFEGFTGDGAGAIDPELNIYLRSTKYKFVMWDLNHEGPDNKNVGFLPDDPSGLFDFARLPDYGMDYDPVRGVFILWKGDGEVWTLTPPALFTTTGWVLTPLTPGTANDVPDTGGTGVFGKWKYVEEQDIFIGVNDSRNGDVWLYKPHDWQPSNELPVLTLAGASLSARPAGQHLHLTDLIEWSDADGDTLSFRFIDLTADPDSGHFLLNGTVQSAGREIAVSAKQLELGDLLWVVGEADDEIEVKISDPFGSAPVASILLPGDSNGGMLSLIPSSNGAVETGYLSELPTA